MLEEVCGREAAEAAFEGVFFVRTVLGAYRGCPLAGVVAHLPC